MMAKVWMYHFYNDELSLQVWMDGWVGIYVISNHEDKINTCLLRVNTASQGQESQTKVPIRSSHSIPSTFPLRPGIEQESCWKVFGVTDLA